jgi:hypothetical protein
MGDRIAWLVEQLRHRMTIWGVKAGVEVHRVSKKQHQEHWSASG